MSTTTTDPIADMLARIRNGLAVNKSEINLPHSKTKEAVAKLLKENKYIVDVKTVDASIGKSLVITLATDEDRSRITEITRLSKPGRRMYTSADKMPTVKQGRGLVIVSTSKGLMTGLEAKNQRIGGELICSVY